MEEDTLVRLVTLDLFFLFFSFILFFFFTYHNTCVFTHSPTFPVSSFRFPFAGECPLGHSPRSLR
jgi:hypothetical protein